MTEFFKNKNILVAGGTGMIGSFLSEKLLTLGANVKIVAKDNKFNILPELYEEVDLTNLDACLRIVEGQDYVFNLTGVKSSTQAKDTTAASQFVSCLMMNTNLMEAAFRNNVERFMCVGSINQYKQSSVAQMEGGDLQQVGRATDEGNNDRFSAQVKHMNEIQAQAYYLEHKWKAPRMVRLSSVYGPRDNFGPISHVIPSLINKILSGQDPLVIAGNGGNQRDFIYVDDVVDGILTVMEHGKPCDPVNIGSGYGVIIKHLIYMLCNITKIFPEIKYNKNLPTGDLIRIIDITKATKLGFYQKISLQDGLIKTIDWYKEQISGKKD